MEGRWQEFDEEEKSCCPRKRRLNVLLALEPAGAYRSVMSESDRDSELALDPDGQRLFM